MAVALAARHRLLVGAASALLASAGCALDSPDALGVLRDVEVPPPPPGWTATFAWEQTARCSVGDCRPAVREQTWACRCLDHVEVARGVVEHFLGDGFTLADERAGQDSLAVLLEDRRDGVTVWVKLLAAPSSGPGVGPPGSAQVDEAVLGSLAGGDTVVIRLSDQRDW